MTRIELEPKTMDMQIPADKVTSAVSRIIGRTFYDFYFLAPLALGAAVLTKNLLESVIDLCTGLNTHMSSKNTLEIGVIFLAYPTFSRFTKHVRDESNKLKEKYVR